MTVVRTLETRVVEKVWGRDTLPPPFVAPAGQRIGEVWFEPPPELPELLVKYLFTNEKLSVQVHPSDSDAPEGCRGKDECWLVMAAEPNAQLAVGFARDVSPEAIRSAASDGTIESLLAWRTVSPGDFVYLPAGTVHAIGAGVSLVEIQQNSDVTYRLYDYGRPRELHLGAAIAVACGAPHEPALRRSLPATGHVRLVEGPHFRLDRLDGQPDSDIAERYSGGPLLVVPLDGAVIAESHTFPAGTCAILPSLGDVRLAPGAMALIAQPI